MTSSNLASGPVVLRSFLFAGDVGGLMGLLLGGSVLTIFEFLDFIIYNSIRKWAK